MYFSGCKTAHHISLLIKTRGKAKVFSEFQGSLSTLWCKTLSQVISVIYSFWASILLIWKIAFNFFWETTQFFVRILLVCWCCLLTSDSWSLMFLAMGVSVWDNGRKHKLLFFKTNHQQSENVRTCMKVYKNAILFLTSLFLSFRMKYLLAFTLQLFKKNHNNCWCHKQKRNILLRSRMSIINKLLW